MKVSEGDRVMIVENNKLLKGTVKAVYELMSTAIVALDDCDEARKVTIDKLLPLYETETELNDGKPPVIRNLLAHEFWDAAYYALYESELNMKEYRALLMCFVSDLMNDLFNDETLIVINEITFSNKIQKIASPEAISVKNRNSKPTALDRITSDLVIKSLNVMTEILFPHD